MLGVPFWPFSSQLQSGAVTPYSDYDKPAGLVLLIARRQHRSGGAASHRELDGIMGSILQMNLLSQGVFTALSLLGGSEQRGSPYSVLRWLH